VDSAALPVKAACIVALLVAAVLPAAGAEPITIRHATATPVAAGNAQRAVDVSLPHDWADHFPGFSGQVDYRAAFERPPAGELLAIHVPRACTNVEVRVNGHLIGSGGRMQPPLTRNCYHSQLFAVPDALLQAGRNELLVRVAGFAEGEVSARQRAAGLSEVRIGPAAILSVDHERQRFWNVTLAQVISGTLAALGIAVLGLWTVRRRESYLLHFGLLTVGWAVLSMRLVVRDLPLSHHIQEVLTCAAFFPVASSAFVFLARMVGRRWRWMDWGLAAQAVLAVLALMLAPHGKLLDTATVLYGVLALELLASGAMFFVLAWRTQRRDFWLVGAVLPIVLVLSAIEVALQNGLVSMPRVHLIHFAMPIVFAAISVRLIQLFVQALRQAETLNEQLEQRVLEKSREIERSWQQIAQLRSTRAAEEERRRIAADLHDDLGAQLLSIVRASQRGGHPDRIAGMARHALDEMRLSVRGLTGTATALDDLLADWRSETVTRLTEAGLQVQWDADEPPQHLAVPARMQVQLTRVLREAISNAIRHSGATRVRVSVRLAGTLRLEVEDDGCGLPAPEQSARHGHGLANIERRLRALGGAHRYESPEHGGTRLVAEVPLARDASLAKEQP
jgi:signal transduction histidine kinase